MAFTAAEVEEFISAIQQDPALRDRVRNAILADDFLALPSAVHELVEQGRRMEAAIERLTERMADHDARLALHDARMDRLTERMDQLIAQVARQTGQLGNLTGKMFEFNYDRKVSVRMGRRFRGARIVALGTFKPFLAAYDRGDVSDADWDELANADLIVLAHDGRTTDAPEVLLAVELSVVVDQSDVMRAHRRAGLLRKTGMPTYGVVDGDMILPEAKAQALELGVVTVVQRETSAA